MLESEKFNLLYIIIIIMQEQKSTSHADRLRRERQLQRNSRKHQASLTATLLFCTWNCHRFSRLGNLQKNFAKVRVSDVLF